MKYINEKTFLFNLIIFFIISCLDENKNNIDLIDPSPIITYNPNCPDLSYSSRPNPVYSDNTHNYYEYAWQIDPKICINVYDESLLGGREQKVYTSMEWVKLNLPNIIPINVFYIDQYNASQEAKNDFDTVGFLYPLT